MARPPLQRRNVARCTLLALLVAVAAGAGLQAWLGSPLLWRRGARRALLQQSWEVDALSLLRHTRSWATGLELAHNLNSPSTDALVEAYQRLLAALLERPIVPWVGHSTQQRFCRHLAGVGAARDGAAAAGGQARVS